MMMMMMMMTTAPTTPLAAVTCSGLELFISHDVTVKARIETL